MKIGNPADKPVASPVAPAAPGRVAAGESSKTPGAPATAADPGVAEASAQVALSSAATSLLSGSSAEFDSDKVSRIAQAISEGKFEINAGAIADRLIANAKEVLGKPSSH